MARYVQLQESDVQKIASNYDLIVVNFESIEGGSSSTNYLLRTRQGNYVLTVFEIPLARAVKIGQLLLLLAEYGFPTSRLLPPTQGGIATMHKEQPAMVKTYIAGQVRKDLDTAMLRQVGAAMAGLHQIPAPDFLSDKHAYGLQVFSNVIGRNVNPGYESWLAKRLSHLQQHISPELPRGLIHGDLFYDNVLFEEGALKAVIDFEEVCHYYKVFDLGMGVVGLCAEGTMVALDKARALATGYQQIRRLEEKEKEALQLFVEYGAIATSCWRFWKYHIDTPSAEKADKHLQMVRIAENIRAIPKARFLETVFN